MRREVKDKFMLAIACTAEIAGLIAAFCISWKAMLVYFGCSVIGAFIAQWFTGKDKTTLLMETKTEVETRLKEYETVKVEKDVVTTPEITESVPVVVESEVVTPVHTKPKKKQAKKNKKQTVKE